MEKTAEEVQKELDAERAQNAENIKALQQKLTEKDVAVKKALEDIEALKKQGGDESETKKEIAALTETVKTLTDQIGETKTKERIGELSKKFPDIAPELLIGRTDEECEKLAGAQRAKAEETFGRRPSAHEPIYKDRDSIDAEIERITNDRTMRTDEKLVKVRELKLRKEDL
jgi:seryl-tRNA synthetase